MILFQHSHSIKLLHESDHGPEFLHFSDYEGLGEQIHWILFSRDVIRFNNLVLVLFLYIMVLYVDMFSSTFDCWIYH